MEEMAGRPSDQIVAGRVRAELGRKRMSQAALARHLHRTQMYMHRRLHGEVPFGALELATVAEVLDVPVEQFLRGAA